MCVCVFVGCIIRAETKAKMMRQRVLVLSNTRFAFIFTWLGKYAKKRLSFVYANINKL